ncbi:MAG: flagellar basal-body rod protein FlgF [Deltaproteobacteria bacterium]|nr:flagellar basal-body rod protein FlgF [Deltaproteobacteria bacterium]
MSQALFSAASGATYHEKRLAVLANNLANISTVGYKQDKLIFKVPKAEAQKVSAGAKRYFLYSPPPMPSATAVDFSQGGLKATGKPLDVAISGDGFFCIQTPRGRRYTRNGSFVLNQDGVLTTREGWPVQGGSGSITLSGQDVRIDERGNVYVDGDQVGALKVVKIQDLHRLRKVGDGMFAPLDDEAVEMETKDVLIKQGFLESSNVNGLRAMTEMIDVMRGYESYQKVIHFLDDVARRSITDVGRL